MLVHKEGIVYYGRLLKKAIDRLKEQSGSTENNFKEILSSFQNDFNELNRFFKESIEHHQKDENKIVEMKK